MKFAERTAGRIIIRENVRLTCIARLRLFENRRGVPAPKVEDSPLIYLEQAKSEGSIGSERFKESPGLNERTKGAASCITPANTRKGVCVPEMGLVLYRSGSSPIRRFSRGFPGRGRGEKTWKCGDAGNNAQFLTGLPSQLIVLPGSKNSKRVTTQCSFEKTSGAISIHLYIANYAMRFRGLLWQKKR